MGSGNSFSTTHTLISLTELIYNALDNSKFICGVFIDLRKAFDAVNHKILPKLEYCGVFGLSLSWFQSYLKNRQQFTGINGVKPDLLENTYHILQGSILGPLLFLRNINDLNKAILFFLKNITLRITQISYMRVNHLKT